MENGPDMAGKIPTVSAGENAKMAELVNHVASSFYTSKNCGIHAKRVPDKPLFVYWDLRGAG